MLKITPEIIAIFMVKGTVFTIKFGFFFEKNEALKIGKIYRIFIKLPHNKNTIDE
jgi:hypothetical protein